MPQVDIENLVSACAGGCSDNKIACETQTAGSTDDEPTENGVIPDGSTAVNIDPDFPPESYWLSKDAEYDWFDRNAFYDRKDSAKGNSNSTNLNPNSNSNSQRFSVNLKSKASIIGLPKPQKTTYVDCRRRASKSANIGLFPKRPAPVGKSTVPMVEPGSPKVSCMGRVRSKRGRRRSNSLKKIEKQLEKSRSSGDKRKTNFYSKVISIFRSKKGHKKPSKSGSRKVVVEVVEEKPVVFERQRESVNSEVREIPVHGGTTVEPPSLGGVKRFASGRRSGSWTAEDFN